MDEYQIDRTELKRRYRQYTGTDLADGMIEYLEAHLGLFEAVYSFGVKGIPFACLFPIKQK